MTRSPWIRAARLQLHTIGFTPLLLGNIIAWYEHGYFSWPRFILSLLIGLLIHLVTAFVNDVADIHTDEANLSRTPFSGGSGRCGGRTAVTFRPDKGRRLGSLFGRRL